MAALSPEEAGKRKRYTRKRVAAITTHHWSQGWRPGCIRLPAFLHTVIGRLYNFNDYFIAVLNISVLALVIIYRTALFERPHAFAAPPGAVVVLRGISRRCEGVRAGNRSPSLWGCQGLDKSCLNFTLRKMPCVNSCPWPERSDRVLQTPEGQPICPREMEKCDSAAQNGQELTSGRFLFFVFFCGENPTVGAAGRKVQIVFADSSPSCSLLPCLGQLALVAESLRQVSCRFVRGWSHLCLLSLCRTVCHSEGILLILHVSYGRSFKHSKCWKVSDGS